MPILARDELGALVRLDDKDLRLIGELARRGGVNMQPAEPAPQLLVPLRTEPLLAEEDHQMVHECRMHLPELLVIERLGQIDAVDLGTDLRGRFAYFDGPVGHVCSNRGVENREWFWFRPASHCPIPYSPFPPRS
jgi:hypothetical protein